jgi:hypothetical protein
LGKVVMTSVIVATLFVVLAGVFLLTFVFHFKGLVGYILASDDEPRYSLVTTGTAVSTATGDPDSFIVRWIQVCFFGFGVIMPLFFLLLMLVVWAIPMEVATFRKCVVWAEVANAWNAIDVFVVSVVAALFEIQQFAEFIIGDSCDAINELLEEKNPNPNGDNKCFDVTAGLLPRFWVLGLAAGIMMTFGLFLLRFAQSDLTARRRLDRHKAEAPGEGGGGILLRSSLSMSLSHQPGGDRFSLYERNDGSSIALSPESSTLSEVPSLEGVQEEEGEGTDSRSRDCAHRFSAGMTLVLLAAGVIEHH